MAYEGIYFSFADVQREIENLKVVSKRFLEPRSFLNIIPNWQRALEFYEHDPHPIGSVFHWEITDGDPIKTIVSNGEYEAGSRRGRYQLYGSVSGIWHITKPPYKGKKKRAYRSNVFILNGIASSKIRLWARRGGNDEEIARWTMEIGDVNSPGCHFHTQIRLDSGDNKFPEDLPVPRLPTILVTPMDALEFLLAELFYTNWYEHVSMLDSAKKILASCQSNRLQKLLKWHLSKITESKASPWTMFKRQKPPLDIFHTG